MVDSTTDDWCRNACVKSCPPLTCTCDGERHPIDVNEEKELAEKEAAKETAKAEAAREATIDNRPPLKPKDSLSCMSISVGTTDSWCKINCASGCPMSMCVCDEEADKVTAARADQMEGDDSPFATDDAPRYDNGAPKPPEWVADDRNFNGGNMSCFSTDGKTSDSWCQLNCATPTAHMEISCPPERCDCGKDAAKRGEEERENAMQNWKEAEARVRGADPDTAYPDGLPPAEKSMPAPAGSPDDLKSCKAIAAPASDLWCREICGTGVCPPDKCKCKGGNSDLTNWKEAEKKVRHINDPSTGPAGASITAEREAKVEAAWPAGVHGPGTGADAAAIAVGATPVPKSYFIRDLSPEPSPSGAHRR